MQPEIVAACFSIVCTCKREMSAYESLLGAVHLTFSVRYAIAGEMYLHSFLKTETGGCTVSDRYVPAHHRSVCSTGTDHRGMWRIRFVEFVGKSYDVLFELWPEFVLQHSGC